MKTTPRLLFAVACLLFLSGCMTSTRITVRDGQREASVVMPKNYRATNLDFSLKTDGTARLKATTFEASASKVIDSAAGALGELAAAAKDLAPLAK